MDQLFPFIYKKERKEPENQVFVYIEDIIPPQKEIEVVEEERVAIINIID